MKTYFERAVLKRSVQTGLDDMEPQHGQAANRQLRYNNVYNQRIHKICLPDSSPGATLNFNGNRVERTGCLDQRFVLPHSNDYVKVDTLAHWKREV